MQSRYYDPTTCRFINADSYTSTGQGIIGHNMFAYCLNSPTTYIDDSGAMACTTFLGDNHVLSDNYLTGGCGGGNSKAIPSSRSASAKVIEGEIAFFTNTSEEVVLDAEYIAFYKGALVIKIPSMENRGFTFGAILIGPDVDANLVRHEYGHMVQLWETDIITYTACFAMPSIACFWLSEWDVLSWDDYNNRPWEYLADQFGGASREHASWAAPVGEIYWYIIEKARLLP